MVLRMYRSAARCCVVLRSAAWCCVVLRGAAWCCVVLRGAAWCCVKCFEYYGRYINTIMI